MFKLENNVCVFNVYKTGMVFKDDLSKGGPHLTEWTLTPEGIPTEHWWALPYFTFSILHFIRFQSSHLRKIRTVFQYSWLIIAELSFAERDWADFHIDLVKVGRLGVKLFVLCTNCSPLLWNYWLLDLLQDCLVVYLQSFWKWLIWICPTLFPKCNDDNAFLWCTW